MNVSELAPGLWRWTAPHPDWKEGADWEQEVGCVYYEAAGATVLIDPLVPPEQERFFDALDRDVQRRGLPVSILLTVPWHARSSAELAERYETTTQSIAFWNRAAYVSLDPDSSSYAPDRIKVSWRLRLHPGVELDPEDLNEPSPSSLASPAVMSSPT